MTDQRKFDLLYDGLQALRHRNLEIATNYGSQSINGRTAYEEIREIEELKRLLYPLTSRKTKWKTSV